MVSSTAEHGTNRSQDLSKFVVKLARYMQQRGLLGRNQFLRQFAALLGETRESCEEPAVGLDQIEAGEQNCAQDRGKKYVHLPLHAIVDPPNAERNQFLAFIVLDEQASDCRAQRGLASL